MGCLDLSGWAAHTSQTLDWAFKVFHETKVKPQMAGMKRNPMEAFVMHTRELLESDAWMSRPLPVVKLINRLEVEHLAHGGRENGNLRVSYRQFTDIGIGKNYIKPAIDYAVDVGLVEVKPDPIRSPGDLRPACVYTLRYLANDGKKLREKPWKKINESDLAQALGKFTGANRRKGESSKKI